MNVLISIPIILLIIGIVICIIGSLYSINIITKSMDELSKIESEAIDDILLLLKERSI